MSVCDAFLQSEVCHEVCHGLEGQHLGRRLHQLSLQSRLGGCCRAKFEVKLGFLKGKIRGKLAAKFSVKLFSRLVLLEDA